MNKTPTSKLDLLIQYSGGSTWGSSKVPTDTIVVKLQLSKNETLAPYVAELGKVTALLGDKSTKELPLTGRDIIDPSEPVGSITGLATVPDRPSSSEFSTYHLTKLVLGNKKDHNKAFMVCDIFPLLLTLPFSLLHRLWDNF
jgi:hypothetical protein